MTINVLCKKLVHCDAPESWQLGLQDSATAAHEGMYFFYNYLTIFIIIIGVAVCYVLYYIIVEFNDKQNKEAPLVFSHSSELEIIWTCIPAFLLIIIAVPSFNLLYSLDELIDPELTLKIVGHQWYWSYEYSDWETKFETFTDSCGVYFDSYMLDQESLPFGSFRLLEVDNAVVLPINTHIRLLVTASDVLHSWAIPSFGIKVDACPGRLSQASLFLKRLGTFYGQCSEICGVNHGFMPISVQSVSLNSFNTWFMSKSISL